MIARYPGKDLIDLTPRPAFFTPAQLIASISIPVLLIGGEFDLESRKRFAEDLKLQLPQAERALVPGSGHLCNLDNPLAYNSAVRDFLARHVIEPQLH
jgi:pimeloyl-ACP methyl ester carboxylesterase